MNNCNNCPVNDGYKPAEAVHEIAEPKTAAIYYADLLENGEWINYATRAESAAELRRQHARIAELEAQLAAAQQAVQAAQDLESIEKYRMQMVGISTAALGYWKEGDAIHPDYDTVALRDVAQLYAKYDALYKAAHPAEGAPAQAEPFMWAIQEPGGSAYMDKNCVSTSRGIVEAEVDGLNLGLDADDEPYKVVPVYLAATQPAQAVPSDDDAFQAAIDMLHSARVELDLLREALNVPVEPHQSLFERVLDAAKATHPTQQGMDAIAALQKVRDIAVSALLTGSLDRQDWIDDMDRIAAQAKQGEQANG